MPLISCVTDIALNWSKLCVLAAITVANQKIPISTTDMKLYVPVATL